MNYLIVHAVALCAFIKKKLQYHFGCRTLESESTSCLKNTWLFI